MCISFVHGAAIFFLQEQCSKSLCDMRSGEQILESSIASSSSMPPGRTQSAGWSNSPAASAKTRRAAFIRRPVREASFLDFLLS